VDSNIDLKNKVIELTSSRLITVEDNVYKESLRSMLYTFGNLHYLDGNGNRIKVNTTHGNPERIVSRLKSDNTLVLPLITVVEARTEKDQEKEKHQNVIIEKCWDPKTRRAIRVLSLPPRPLKISYSVNLWCKYKSDMDMLRSNIFYMFSPDMEIATKYSSHNKSFIVREKDLGSLVAQDTGDRVLQKSIDIVLETYLPTPSFRVTSTGEITEFNAEVVLREESTT